METNFFNNHGYWFLFFIFFFPRLTMLFATVTPFSFLCWIGWFLHPTLLAAILALPYKDSNPFLVGVVWAQAIIKTLGFFVKILNPSKNDK